MGNHAWTVSIPSHSLPVLSITSRTSCRVVDKPWLGWLLLAILNLSWTCSIIQALKNAPVAASPVEAVNGGHLPGVLSPRKVFDPCACGLQARRNLLVLRAVTVEELPECDMIILMTAPNWWISPKCSRGWLERMWLIESTPGVPCVLFHRGEPARICHVIGRLDNMVYMVDDATLNGVHWVIGD